MVEKFAGDAVMAVFGVPTAHEDDAERAVRAAVAIVETGSDELPVRIGIEAGEVVVEDGDSTFATGEALNVAARLQQSAEPGEILIGPTAYGLTTDRDRHRVEPPGVRSRASATACEVRRVVCTERPIGQAAERGRRRTSGARRSSSCSRTRSRGPCATGGPSS